MEIRDRYRHPTLPGLGLAKGVESPGGIRCEIALTQVSRLPPPPVPLCLDASPFRSVPCPGTSPSQCTVSLTIDVIRATLSLLQGHRVMDVRSDEIPWERRPFRNVGFS